MRFRRRKNHELQGVIHLYREQTGETDVDLRKVAEFALTRLHWRMPPPLSPTDRLAKDLRDAAREETRYDPVMKLRYRVNHFYPGTRDGEPRTLCTDIDRAPRGPMLMSFQLRRKGMVDDGYHLALDVKHWNRKNPDAEPIQVVLDLTRDVEEHMQAPDEQDDAG